MPRQQRDGFNVGLLERHQRPEPRRKVVDGHVIRSAAHGNRLAVLALMVDLVGRARRARRTLPRNPPHLVGFVRTHDPRREKLVAGKPLEEREMTRIASARWLKELIHRTRIQHLCANLRARLIETRHIRKILAALADRIKLSATRLGFAVRALQFGPRLKHSVGSDGNLSRRTTAHFGEQFAKILYRGRRWNGGPTVSRAR